MHADIESANQGGKVELKLGLKTISAIVGLVSIVLGTFVSVTFYVFQTRQQAIVEHAELKGKADLDRQAVNSHMKTSNKKDRVMFKALKAQSEALQTIHINQEVMMRQAGVGKRKIEPFPASAAIDFDDQDEIE